MVDMNSVFAFICGMALGSAFGYFQAWRTARRLEHLGVKIREWDAISMADIMPRPADVTAVEQRSQIRQVR